MGNQLRLGWVGCGVMGRWMAQHCMERGKHRLVIHSRTPSKCQPLIDLGAVLCNSPAAVAQSSVDVIVTMAGYPKDLEEIVYGPNGIIEGIKSLEKGSQIPILIDMSTSQPALAQRIDSTFRQYGSFALDAPVSGGDIGAREGRLSIMVGGNREIFDRLEDLFRCMAIKEKGGKIEYMGEAGSGQHTKMANQILIATNMVGVCEALLYSHKVGLNPEDVLKAVSSGAAGSWSLSNLAPRMLARNFEPGFYVEHFVKDMEIALDEARRANLSLPGLALAHQLYIALKAQGGAKQGTQALLLALERMNAILP